MGKDDEQTSSTLRITAWNAIMVLSVAMLLWGLPLLSLQAHPFHTTLSQMDWNSHSERWEVGLRVDANDLELAIQRQSGNHISLDDEAAAVQIQKYLNRHFGLTLKKETKESSSEVESKLARDVDGFSLNQPFAQLEHLSAEKDTAHHRPSTNLQWVGHEIEGSWVWLYFELEGLKSNQPLVVVNSVLGEINEDQINIISVRHENRWYSLQTSQKRWWAELNHPSTDDS